MAANYTSILFASLTHKQTRKIYQIHRHPGKLTLTIISNKKTNEYNGRSYFDSDQKNQKWRGGEHKEDTEDGEY